MGRSDRAALRTAYFAACIVLVAQFLLGMVVNLFVTIPPHHPGAGASNYFAGVTTGMRWAVLHSPLWLTAHAVLGLVLAIAAIISVATAFRSASRAAIVTSIAGALAIIGAGFNGASFLNYGKNVSSMIMAGLFAVALCSYLTGLYLIGGATETASAADAAIDR